MLDGCPFCEYEGPSEVLAHYDEAFVIEPLEPCTPGHMLVVPYVHHDRTDAHLGEVLAELAACAGRWWVESGRHLGPTDDCNLILNLGPAATQTVAHLHLHVVPRRHGDGLALPWVRG